MAMFNVCYVLITCSLFHVISAQHLEDQHYWSSIGKEELEESLKVKWNERTAKNVILFVGDGMGPNTITASRIFKGNEKTKFSFEQFPHIGLLKTYSVNKQVPDSASTASALFAGVKVNFYTVGVDANVKLQDCQASLNQSNRFKSIIQWAQDAGKDTGFVTNTRITHATPAALYAHAADRNWECDGKMPSGTQKCKDIARQLIEDLPGKNIKVIMGGGRQILQTNFTVTQTDPIDNWACRRRDKRNLINDWVKDKEARKLSYQVLNNTEDLLKLDVENTDYVMGVFANGHMAYDHARDKSNKGMPSLKEMTIKAIEILQKSENGYLLVVEGGLIDQAHHKNFAKKALHETVHFDETISETLKLVAEQDRANKNTFIYKEPRPETLVIVTSDHAHSLSINGYPNRGNSILGLAQNSTEDGIPYTTLGYTTGDSLAMNYSASTDGKKILRANPLKYDTESFNYHQQGSIHTAEAYHGGGDVAVYATGPMAHLFHNVHEQNYVAHVIGYAAKIGPYSRTYNASSSKSKTKSLYFISILTIFITLYLM